MKLLVARHGETTWNVAGLLMGRTPGELTEQGKKQAQVLANRVARLKPDVLYSSDLQRAVDTTHIVHIACPAVPVTFVPDLQERDFGDYEGKPSLELAATGFWDIPPDETRFNAESEAAFTRRVGDFVAGIHRKHPHEAVLLISHIGVMNRLQYLSDPKTFTFTAYPNAEPVEFDIHKILRHITWR
jgi:probable phosphoglycerate mutase